jgi:hypothetical protein
MKTIWPVLFCTIAGLGILLFSAHAGYILSSGEKNVPEAKYLKIFKQIYDEVKELGPYPGEDFIRREFFIGNEDDDDTNKNQHVVVLIQTIDGREQMRIQVTTMEPTKENPQVKYATESKSILCQVMANVVTIQTSDYDERELERLAAEILRAILGKKKLLKVDKIPPWPKIGLVNPATAEDRNE